LYTIAYADGNGYSHPYADSQANPHAET